MNPRLNQPGYIELLRRRGFRHGSLLIAGSTRAGAESLLGQAKANGVQADLFDPAAMPAGIAPEHYGAAILLHPAGDLLLTVHAALRPDAPLLLSLPRMDKTAVHLLLLRHGFHDILVRDGRDSIIASATRGALPPRPKCSIIVAAFNESPTFAPLMDALLKKELPAVDREIIVVESNSTDGTREIALRYQSHPDVKLVLQDRARGKGHAIREGFRHVTGDIVLIQDADLEYDLDDYDILLAPILAYDAVFVLGTRHAGNWKMRRFAKQKFLADTLNFGHAFFTGLINFLYRQNMTDPFTMFKVFRRDCLFGLEFGCNRFDFDHELVIKFVRKGYRPLEVPVNYASRSFREGKKVRLFRDPLTWLWVDLKLRFTRVVPKNPDKCGEPRPAPQSPPAADSRRAKDDVPARDRAR